ncbi:hypothetical protein Godav_018409 [Gossypium davidsonii]|uniref:RNase H type-1 domain-containing protein n=1 Tax=Gossypium davidsonii TaxID=34287 RepID=A0A7J8QWB5_GOSDV|nr:hypothetical protein [Gossypium davidsonii]
MCKRIRNNGICVYGVFEIKGDLAVGRNQLLHEGKNITASETANFIRNYLEEIDGINERTTVKQVLQVSWKAPNEQFVKINFDVAFCKQNNKSCLGIIIRDTIGRVLFSKSILYGNIPSPFAVEALACFQMIKMELHVGLTRVEIEGDTLSVIRKLQSEGIDRSVIGAHILNIRAICERYQVCVFKHTLRQANEVAHLLVVERLKRDEEIYLIGEVPFYAKEVAKEEIPT